MNLKTKQQLIDEGFKFIAKNDKNDMEVWARFTKYQDNIQYLYFKENVCTTDVMVISYNQLQLMGFMNKIMSHYYLKENIQQYEEDVLSRWVNDNIWNQLNEKE